MINSLHIDNLIGERSGEGSLSFLCLRLKFSRLRFYFHDDSFQVFVFELYSLNKKLCILIALEEKFGKSFRHGTFLPNDQSLMYKCGLPK